MGSCCSSKKLSSVKHRGKKTSVTKHAVYLNSLFKTPIHDEIENPTFSFKARLARDMLQSEPYNIKTLLDLFDLFILEVSYSLEKTKVISTQQPELSIEELISRGFYHVTIRLDPFLDLVWREAITYTKPYYRLSSLMVGKCLDRTPKDAYFDLSWIMLIWPNYTYPMAVYESGYMIWTSMDDYKEMVKMLANHYFTYIEPASKVEPIRVEDVMACLNTCLNAFKHQVKNQSEAVVAEEFDFKLNSSVESIPVEQKLQEIRDIVFKPRLKETIQRELNLTEDLAALYMEEYCAFLTMMLYSTEELTPSDEVDRVWHTHQGFSYKYRKFCLKIYGRLITHNPTVGGRVSKDKYDMQYTRTLSFYQYLFKKPPSNLWPDISIRFGGSYEKNCWVSLFRVLAIITSYKRYVPNQADDGVFIYVREKYMKWPDIIKDRFDFLYETQYTDVNYGILHGSEICLPKKSIPSLQDILSSNEAAFNAIQYKKYAAINRSSDSSDVKITDQNKLAKYDAQIYANRKLKLTSIVYFKVKSAKDRYKSSSKSSCCIFRFNSGGGGGGDFGGGDCGDCGDGGGDCGD